jgi:prepilin-type processing-associated H-X9-DG protein
MRNLVINGANAAAWDNQIQPYVKNWQAFICPSTRVNHVIFGAGGGTSYAYNFCLLQGQPMAKFQYPAETCSVLDWRYACVKYNPACGCSSNCTMDHSWWPTNNAAIVPPHMDGLNVGYMDGHVKWMSGNDGRDNYTNKKRLFYGT